jgi:hypothetical protein
MVKKLATFATVALITVIGLTAMGAEKGPGESKDTKTGQVQAPDASLASGQSAARNAERPATKETKRQTRGKGLTAIDGAAKAKKYLFIFCYKSDDEQTQKMRERFDTVTKKVRKRANSTKVNIADPAEKGIVDKFKLEGAPSPLVLVLAPNGALTGGFPVEFFDEKQLMEAFATPCMEKCLKALQDGNLVFLCIQNTSSNSKDAALEGVMNFKADPRFSRFTQIVMLDPTDSAETKFLGQLKVDPKSSEAVTVLLTPPGTVAGKFSGQTDKAKLVTAISAARSGCCGSGSKSSCAPK